jgi:hypothetical protein
MRTMRLRGSWSTAGSWGRRRRGARLCAHLSFQMVDVSGGDGARTSAICRWTGLIHAPTRSKQEQVPLAAAERTGRLLDVDGGAGAGADLAKRCHGFACSANVLSDRRSTNSGRK